jgi:hypothetical protein
MVGMGCDQSGVKIKTPVAAFGTDITLKGQAMNEKLLRKVNAPHAA